MRIDTLLVFLAIGVGSTQASTITRDGPGGAIPDADPSGSPPGVFTSDIVLNDPGFVCSGALQPADCNGTNNFVSVTITGLQHTFAGDLIATLTNINSGISQDLFNRIQKNPSDPNDFGCACQFNGDYSFDQSTLFPNDIWTAASGSADTIPSDNYWTTTAGSDTPTMFSAAFGGLPAAGTWRLTISDNSPGDTGSFLSWTLSLDVTGLTSVPEPSLAIPTGLLVLGFVLLRRRLMALTSVAAGTGATLRILK
jgi:hypothetical protein